MENLSEPIKANGGKKSCNSTRVEGYSPYHQYPIHPSRQCDANSNGRDNGMKKNRSHAAAPRNDIPGLKLMPSKKMSDNDA